MSAVAVPEMRMLERYRRMLTQLDPVPCRGRVIQVVGLTVEVEGLTCRIMLNEASNRYRPRWWASGTEDSCSCRLPTLEGYDQGAR